MLVAAVSRTHKLRVQGKQNADQALALTDLHARNARRYIDGKFHELWANDDALKTRVGHAVVDGEHAWLSDTTRTAQPLEADALDRVAK